MVHHSKNTTTKTYALRDSSKVNSLYSQKNKKYSIASIDSRQQEKQEKQEQQSNHETTNEDSNPYNTENKEQTQPHPSSSFYSDFYTEQDPQYYQHAVVVKSNNSSSNRGRRGSRRKKSKMAKRKTTSIPKQKRQPSSSVSIPNDSNAQQPQTQQQHPPQQQPHPPQDEIRIRTPHNHDVLCGRGGNVNSHPGNIYFRQKVNLHKETYNTTHNKTEKSIISQQVIDDVHRRCPRGRFLKKVEERKGGASSSGGSSSGFWVEVDHDKAMAKTSQALREGAPKIRAVAAATATASGAHPDTTLTMKGRRGSRRALSKGPGRKGRKRKQRYDIDEDYVDEEEYKDHHEEEERVDAASRPFIRAMPNGRRGKQLVPRSEEEGEGQGGGVGLPTIAEASAANMDGEEKETEEERAHRNKRLKLIMKPRSEAVMAATSTAVVPATPDTPASSTTRPPCSSAADAAATTMPPLTLPQSLRILPNSSMMSTTTAKPDAFYRAHSLASDEINGSSSFRGDELFVDPFQNEETNYENVRSHHVAAAATTTTSTTSTINTVQNMNPNVNTTTNVLTHTAPPVHEKNGISTMKSPTSTAIKVPNTPATARIITQSSLSSQMHNNHNHLIANSTIRIHNSPLKSSNKCSTHDDDTNSSTRKATTKGSDSNNRELKAWTDEATVKKGEKSCNTNHCSQQSFIDLPFLGDEELISFNVLDSNNFEDPAEDVTVFSPQLSFE